VTGPGPTELAAAWEELHDATPPGWHVGQPLYIGFRDSWELYAFDPSERPKVGLRSREWTAVAPTEEGVVCEMARCLRETRQPDLPPPHE